METINFNVERSKRAAKIHGQRLNNKWYGMNCTNVFGCVTYLFKKYGYPSSPEEFYNMYINDEWNYYFAKEQGRSYKHLLQHAKELRRKDGNLFPLSVYFDFMCQKLFVDTFYGLAMESEVKKMLEESGFTCTTPTLWEDKDYAIDLKVYMDDNFICIVQVKPNTFFKGNGNDSLINDRKSAIEKEKKVTSIYNVPTFYIIYKKDSGKFIEHNGKYCFRLHDLINNDGTTKNNI